MEGSRQGVHLPAHALIRQTPAPVVLHVLSHFLPPRYVQGWFPPERIPFSFSPKAQGHDIQAWRTPSGSPTGPNWSTSISMKTRKWQIQGIFREYMRTKYEFDENTYKHRVSHIEIERRSTKRTSGDGACAKNHSLTPSEGKFIGRRINKRKREESEVWSAQRVSISSYLHGSQATEKILAPSPNILEGIVVCTPTAGYAAHLEPVPSMVAICHKTHIRSSSSPILCLEQTNYRPCIDNRSYLSSHLLIDGILEQVVDMNQKIKIYYPDTAAVKNQLVSIVQWLVKSPQTNIDYLGNGAGRRTALQHAVNNGNMDLINFLLDHGADVNSASSEDGGATALQIAAIQGYLGIARKLLDLDADVNAAPARRNGRTALEGAAEHGRIDMLRLFFDEGASLTVAYRVVRDALWYEKPSYLGIVWFIVVVIRREFSFRRD
ncbi:ankyrin [Aspergillus niger ATCC 13496]|uniref:Contig An07c0320, genomic contig n=3 Tax=Aspergillus niger TaxID=5061 RepID=A2QPE8_ASPNC|nr:uncharacterized protein An07g09200 [Aspergillus niger]RDH15343.1 ankyrin [Aspergillus niger ATCC 13496]CAK39685.1 unnamed protein product [Aspergillus niger]